MTTRRDFLVAGLTAGMAVPLASKAAGLVAAVGEDRTVSNNVTESTASSSPLLVGAADGSAYTRDRLPLQWTVGHSARGQAPARFVAAAVPGAVQLDWARAENWGPYWYAENFRAYSWMEDAAWTYRTTLRKPQLSAGERLFLVCGGVDYACTVKVGGAVVHAQEGMFTPFDVDVTEAADGAVIEVVVDPAPKVPVPPGVSDPGRKEARQSCKPAVSYFWDFHPRLVPLGIWDDTFLEVRSAAGWLNRAEVSYQLAPDFRSVDVQLVAAGTAGSVRWTLAAPDGRQVFSVEGAPSALRSRVEAPALWWPLGEGPQSLYSSTVEVLGPGDRVVQTIRHRVGFRRIQLVMAPGQFDRTTGGSQPPVPITFEVNGRSIFVRGANWVCPEIFPGTLTADRYREQLDLVAGANMNFLRCWGGAIVNKTAFYDLCDERGILVWQEFPLACNNYEGTPAYLRVLDAESRSILLRRRRHASVAMWCCGNELFNSWSGMTPQDAAIRLIARNCYDLDPDRPFMPSSPSPGIRHGDYRFRLGPDAKSPTVFEFYAAEHATAYMEFGVPAPPSAASLRRFLPADEQWPVRRDGSWLAHNAFNAWHSGEPNSWLYPDLAESYFGPAQSLEQMVARLQLLQAVGYKAIYEEARRQKPVCSAVACWVFNEPWPCAANNSLVAWPNEPKPAYKAVAAANRPTLVSARVPHFDWAPGAEFSAQLFLLNDSPSVVGPLHVAVRIEAGSARVDLGKWECPGTSAGTNGAGPTLKAAVPERTGDTFDLVVEVSGKPELSSRYTFAFKRA